MLLHVHHLIIAGLCYDSFMFALLLATIIGAGFAFLATQNTVNVPVHVANYSWSAIPLYAVAITSLLIGLFLAFLLSLFNWAASSLTLHGKEVRAHKAESTVADLQNKIRELEAKNAELAAKHHEIKEVKAAENPSTVSRITHSFTK
ncbi:hypothetical protein BH09PAT1_BH09PAT1_0160 [soil metagenome]